MTVVVADTSPLNYLSLIDQISILPSLYGEIVVPPEVYAELTDPGAPPEVLKWIQTLPPWLRICGTRAHDSDPPLNRLDPGERAAILFALEQPEVLLLIDDAAGRAEAMRRNIPTAGTLAILRVAAIRSLLDLPTALKRLAGTNFRVSQGILADLLAEDFARKRHSAE